MLEAGGSTVDLVPEIQRVKFTKNFWSVLCAPLASNHSQGHYYSWIRNLAFASFATLSRHPLPAIFQNPLVEEQVVPVIRAVLQEKLAVGRAMGFDEEAISSSVVDDTISWTAIIHKRPDSNHRPSMLLDLECGKAMEIEVIVGEVVRKAKELNVNIPVSGFIYVYEWKN